ncbi:hypothetical protein KEJ27_04620 [Candidatus Bathyarchaeota archaeon]|nr:hypothetical protein [Candidatus Bathyarchaeota archaeon]MBS7617675.1 hypothetical protein [Candidatus Bathyarchaeota archaeon]
MTYKFYIHPSAVLQNGKWICVRCGAELPDNTFKTSFPCSISVSTPFDERVSVDVWNCRVRVVVHGVHIADFCNAQERKKLDRLDYIVVNRFPGAEQIFSNRAQAERTLHNISRWKEIVNLKKANLVLSRRFDLSARGTKHLAFYSTTPIFGVDMWSITGFSDEDAKIFALWFNSTLNLLQMIIHRTETRGAWMKLHEYQIRDSMMLNLKELTSEQRRYLLDLFDKLKKQEFPSIFEQLKSKFPLRVEIDKAILRVLGFGDDEINRTLDYLYPALANEIEQLKRLMEGWFDRNRYKICE